MSAFLTRTCDATTQHTEADKRGAEENEGSWLGNRFNVRDELNGQAVSIPVSICVDAMRLETASRLVHGDRGVISN